MRVAKTFAAGMVAILGFGAIVAANPASATEPTCG
jgi:hypothetical protein